MEINMETSTKTATSGGQKTLVKKYNILYVDDEDTNLRIFKYAFKKDYNVFLALNGNEAMEIMKEHEIHLIITDQRMPAMTGVDLLRKVVPKHPKVIRMIMTGFSDVGVLIDAVNDIGINKYLKKPWDRNDLKSTLDSELERSFGMSKLKVNGEGILVQPDQTESTIEVAQRSFLKSEEQIKEVFSKAFLISRYDDHMKGDVHWVGEFCSGQKAAVLLNSKLEGNSEGVLSAALYSMMTEVILRNEDIRAVELSELIYQEFEKRGFSEYFKQANKKEVGLTTIVLNPKSCTISYCTSNDGIKFLDKAGNIMETTSSGLLDLETTGRVFLYTESFNNSFSGDLNYSQFIDESSEMEFDEQSQFLSAEISGPGAFKGLREVTVLGFELSGY